MANLTIKIPGAEESEHGAERKVLKYPKPTKPAAIVNATINGEPTEFYVTHGRGRTYSYFTFMGVEHYIPGEVLEGTECTIEVPEGYVPTPSKTKSRAEQYETVKAKRAEAKAADGGDKKEESTDPAAEPAAAASSDPAEAAGDAAGDVQTQPARRSRRSAA